MLRIPKEPMSYKSQIKENELLTKLKVIRMVQDGGHSHKKVASIFGCHRNTVARLVRQFVGLPLADQLILLSGTNLSLVEIDRLMAPLAAKSCRPLGHPREPDIELTYGVSWLFHERGWRVGYRSMWQKIKRSFGDYASIDPWLYSLTKLTCRQIRTIYQNFELKTIKVRTSNGQRAHLYDYAELGAFERMHLDTKTLADQHSLPGDVYLNLLENKEIPKYQWTLIDAKTRVRFVAYSYNLNAEFGLKFLLFVLCYIRFTWNNWDTSIVIGFDNGTEFCSSSEDKLEEWNKILKPLNASGYQYNPHFDIRKNLIERSHRVDDSHFLVPRGLLLTDKRSFLEETTNFFTYYNFDHGSSGIGMDDKTPYEVLSSTNIRNPERLMQFLVMILEDNINTIRQTVDSFLFQAELKIKEQKLGKPLNQKQIIRTSTKYRFFSDNAQKVLTQYHHL
jgi:transposase